MLDLYDIHTVISSQIIAQLLYWLGAELFNRIINTRKYLARTKAMQIRMNVSMLEEWARTNNRIPEHYEQGDTNASGETTIEAARRHLAPVIQLLQWLQCFSSLDPNDLEALIGTLQQLKRLSPQQLIYTAKNYRLEVGEKGLPKSAMKYLEAIQKEAALRRERRKTAPPVDSGSSLPSTPTRAFHDIAAMAETPGSLQGTPGSDGGKGGADDDDDMEPSGLNLDPSMMLPFMLPSVTDMLVSYGAGFGGLNREREKKYIPNIPAEFLEKLEAGGGGSSADGASSLHRQPLYGHRDWENEVLP